MVFFDFLRSFFTDRSSNSGLGNAENLHIKQQNNLVSDDIRNPILRSDDDITKELILRIIDNDLDTLTIDYEFTKAPYAEEFNNWDDWKTSQYYINPFYLANELRPIKRIEFKVILTRNVTSLAGAFADMKELEFVNLTDTSMITNMSAMFFRAEAFNQPIGNWDVSNVTNMCEMFLSARAFNQPIGNWDVSNVTDMRSMFRGAKAFNQPIGNWDVSNVTNMSCMFKGALAFNQPIGNWDVSKVTDMASMFCDAYAFNQPIGNWNVSKVTDMGWMFYEARAFNQDISGWKKKTYFMDSSSNSGLGNAENLHIKQQNNLLSDNIRNPILRSADDITKELIQRIIDNDLDSLTIDYEFTKKPFGEEFNKWDDQNKNFDDWKTSQNYINPFYRANKCTPIKRIEFKVILTRNVTSLAGAFAYMTKLEFVNLTDTSMVTNMSRMFYGALAFNQPIGDWDVSNVTNMSCMFYEALAFNQPIGNWDVSNVTNMGGMFCDALAFNQPIGNWDVSNVTNMGGMFEGAYAFNQPIGNWDVSHVTNMGDMFDGAHAFNQPIGNWAVSNVTNMREMFAGASVFNQPIGNWNVSNVTNMEAMFSGASAFNQPIGNWNVSNVTNMSRMFYEASAFNKDISGWKKKPYSY